MSGYALFSDLTAVIPQVASILHFTPNYLATTKYDNSYSCPNNTCCGLNSLNQLVFFFKSIFLEDQLTCTLFLSLSVCAHVSLCVSTHKDRHWSLTQMLFEKSCTVFTQNAAECLFSGFNYFIQGCKWAYQSSMRNIWVHHYVCGLLRKALWGQSLGQFMLLFHSGTWLVFNWMRLLQ